MDWEYNQKISNTILVFHPYNVRVSGKPLFAGGTAHVFNISESPMIGSLIIKP